ncbi:MAG: cob(I)yrinic acid a,c-diamide adenosyltransferase [Oscillospiraceae bacterium]|nr:cob(I)yrinic acid a,c-diamide adenosyltransferase [Oscillospiraceae bacterium]MCI9307992.1 cob(I)yrinic acid a,c-diamide adenosyltransferase [Oscillospiraceae bacterium]MCI9548762.1 cob(I)yrinic acid a,c-diamide adenosyltransferase [Oscillospiraceae bacterium]
MVHLYWGAGKGKTTAAMGLALRALGTGRRVAVVQFLKGRDSGEIPLLEGLGAQVFRGKAGTKFSFQMTGAEKAETRALQTDHLRRALALDAELLVLDEACAAWQTDLIDRDLLRAAVLDRPEGREVVLTGREPPEWMREAADYVTEMRCHRHPFEQGVPARRGVEF